VCSLAAGIILALIIALSDTTLHTHRNLKQISRLQDDVAEIENRIADVHSTVGPNAPRNTAAKLKILSATHAELVTRSDDLWDEVRVTEEYPELVALNSHCASLALTLRDLRRKLSLKLVSQLSEWKQIDRAMGGREIPTGR
jgi:hypothetical protein